jgi:hypothetical protein
MSLRNVSIPVQDYTVSPQSVDDCLKLDTISHDGKIRRLRSHLKSSCRKRARESCLDCNSMVTTVDFVVLNISGFDKKLE